MVKKHEVTMTPLQHAAILGLRHDGFAVIVWHPEELRGVNPRLVEQESISFGHGLIFNLSDDNK